MYSPPVHIHLFPTPPFHLRQASFPLLIPIQLPLDLSHTLTPFQVHLPTPPASPLHTSASKPKRGLQAQGKPVIFIAQLDKLYAYPLKPYGSSSPARSLLPSSPRFRINGCSILYLPFESILLLPPFPPFITFCLSLSLSRLRQTLLHY